jgi:hypothetical protein
MKEFDTRSRSGLAWLTLEQSAAERAVACVAQRHRRRARSRASPIRRCGHRHHRQRARFSSGADIKEFSGGAFYAEPFLPAVCDASKRRASP